MAHIHHSTGTTVATTIYYTYIYYTWGSSVAQWLET